MVMQERTSLSMGAVSRATLCSLLVPIALIALGSQAATADESIQGVWKGQYVCGQGVTGLTLKIDGADPSRLTARFEFCPLPENPSVPSGEFEMAWEYDPSTKELELLPGKWISRPYGYTAVGLTGTLDYATRTLAGSVSSGCETFTLTAQESLQPEDQRAVSDAPPPSELPGEQTSQATLDEPMESGQVANAEIPRDADRNIDTEEMFRRGQEVLRQHEELDRQFEQANRQMEPISRQVADQLEHVGREAEQAEREVERAERELLALVETRNACLKNDDNDAKIEACTKMLQRNYEGDKAVALVSRAIGHSRKGASDQALQDLNAAIEHDPRMADAYVARALLYRDTGMRDEALADLEKAISLGNTIAVRHKDELIQANRRDATAETDCDRLAASPFDPQRTHDGVAFDQVDAVAAINACRRAVEADPDNARLQYQYGRSLTKGQNHPEALAWNRKAADQGYAAAQYNLGVMYSEGMGIPQDHAEAAEWYRKAADQGFVLAQHQLGLMYLDGTGIAQDDAKAAEWYRKAADQGFAFAQSNLGWMYGIGRGVPRDDAEAMRWYRKAADQGLAVAQYNLGLLLEQGVDAPPNALEAARWYELAAAQGHAEAKHRLELQEERDSLEEQKKTIENNLENLRADQVALDQEVERLKKEVAQGELLAEAAQAEAAEDYTRAEEILRALCDDENANACEWLEEAY